MASMSLKTNLLPTPSKGNQQLNLNEHQLPENPIISSKRNNHGLEIDTSSSKTNVFFHTADIPTPRPPPSISRKVSMKQTTPANVSPSSPSTLSNHIPVDEEDDHLFHHDSYANRLRNLVASRQPSVASAPSPVPHHLHATTISIDSPLTPTAFELVEDLSSLPTPHPDHHHHNKRGEHFVFPTTMPNVIPVISTIKPSLSNEIPKLSDNLKLGDEYLTTPLKRETSHHQFPDMVNKEIGQYRISKLLGIGAFSHVYLASHIINGDLYAIKTISKGKLLNDPRVRSSIEREIGVLKFVYHENIVKLEATMETEEMMCIVLEYVQGGELFDFVQSMHQEGVNENKVKKVFLQLLRAVKWLHEHNIVHRDLKLENILIHKTDDTGDEVLKITDFGLARVVDPDHPLLTTRCGSEEYAAPEIVQNLSYDGRKTDTWSLGVILYALLVGYLPFRYDTRKKERVSQLFYRIVKADIKWPKDTMISQEAKDVVQSILTRDPSKRIPIDQIENLPWFHI